MQEDDYDDGREKTDEEIIAGYKMEEGKYLIKVTIWECKDLISR